MAEHCDLALAIQKVTEKIVLKMAAEAKRLTGSKNICLAGGVALNCVANGKLLREGIFDDMWIQPAASDAGGALGAAYCAYHIYFNKPRTADNKTDKMKGSYLGPQFSDLDIQLTEKRYKGVSTYFENTEDLCRMVAGLLDEGKVVGWFQGRMEWGPRALGNRSIISDARKPDIQKKLNLKIKFREGFRPFAPSVLIEDVGVYFDFEKSSPYMLLIADVKQKRRKPLPEGYHALPWRDKLYYLRSDLPAITHIDYSARLQTVHRDTNPLYWQLINTFKERTGYGVIVNTSFNVRGEPIVCNPDDAYRCFMRTEMDYLVMGRFVFDKEKQPEWPEKVDEKDLHGID
ncbi:MAG TPA: carbamoyltransferase C-terminal domain-containing protein [Syntrophorhabdaceae bacterium]|nr:carbamoyltransferase C-terminal domain-containing protein [Syntrophorhabdaceae bacterium]